MGIRFAFDLLLMVSVSVIAFVREPMLGVLLASVSLLVMGQQWRTTLLLGQSPRRVEPKRLGMAVVLSGLLLSPLLLVFDQGWTPISAVEVLASWREEFLPYWVGFALLSVVALLALTLERSKR